MRTARQPLRTLVGSLAIALAFALLLMPIYPTATAQHGAVSSPAEILAPPPHPRTFLANPSSLGLVPEGLALGCWSSLNITFQVTGMKGPLTNVEVSMNFNPPHTQVGDLTATLRAPSSAASRVLFSLTGRNTDGVYGSSADLDGTYTFSDLAPGPHWWTAAAAPALVVPSNTTYRSVGNGGGLSVRPPVTQLTAAFAGLTTAQINGTWTLQICDTRKTNTGGVSAASLTLTGPCNPCPSCKMLSDFDGDGRDDVAGWRPSTQTWFSIDTSPGGSVRTRPFGAPGDVIAPGDYDGDGVTDYAVWRVSPSPPRFVISYSSGPAPFFPSPAFNVPNNSVPVPMDYDGDGKADLAVWNPSTMTWTIVKTTGGPPLVVTMGQSTDVPVPRDYDGDCKADIALWSQSGVWTIIKSSNNSTVTFNLGSAGDYPVPADYDGDGLTDISVWTPAFLATWTVRPSSGGPDIVRQFGSNFYNDEPVPYCCDNDAKSDFAVYRPEGPFQPITGIFYCLHSSTGAFTYHALGGPGDVIVLGAYVLP